MFIKPKDFKKLITTAAKSPAGLGIKNDGEAIWLTAPNWHMWILKDKIPNQQLGDLISLGGWLPETGEAVTLYKEMGQQTEMFEAVSCSAMDRYRECDTEYHVTRVCINESGWCRVLQHENYRVIRAVCIPESMYEMISPLSVDLDNGESQPRGPKAKAGPDLFSHGACFANNHMAFVIPLRGMENTEVELNAMNHVRMYREGESLLDLQRARNET